MEDIKIRLASERDFYPKVCFKNYLATPESLEELRKKKDDGKTDG